MVSGIGGLYDGTKFYGDDPNYNNLLNAPTQEGNTHPTIKAIYNEFIKKLTDLKNFKDYNLIFADPTKMMEFNGLTVDLRSLIAQLNSVATSRWSIDGKTYSLEPNMKSYLLEFYKQLGANSVDSNNINNISLGSLSKWIEFAQKNSTEISKLLTNAAGLISKPSEYEKWDADIALVLMLWDRYTDKEKGMLADIDLSADLINALSKLKIGLSSGSIKDRLDDFPINNWESRYPNKSLAEALETFYTEQRGGAGGSQPAGEALTKLRDDFANAIEEFEKLFQKLDAEANPKPPVSREQQEKADAIKKNPNHPYHKIKAVRDQLQSTFPGLNKNTDPKKFGEQLEKFLKEDPTTNKLMNSIEQAESAVTSLSQQQTIDKNAAEQKLNQILQIMANIHKGKIDSVRSITQNIR